MTTLKATTTRYVLEAEPMEHVSAGGIYIKNFTTNQFAIVRDAGPSVTDRLEPGTRVLIDWNKAVPVKHLDVTYYIIDQTNISAVVEE